MKRLTERDILLLKAASQYHISDSDGTYYQLGGHGNVPIRYNPLTLPNLRKEGYVTYEGYWKTTDVGKAAVEEIEAEMAAKKHGYL
jgi:hypothetical protein